MKNEDKTDSNVGGSSPIISAVILVLAIIVFYAVCTITVSAVTFIVNFFTQGGMS